MTIYEGLICFSLLAMLIIASWFLPKKLGIIGIFLAHLVISVLTLTAILTDFIRGVIPDPDFIWLIGNIIWIVLANILLLPISIFASYRHYLQKRDVH